MTVGEKIQTLRLRAGLSQSQLAEQLCVSRAAVAKWENDNGLPDILNLKALASFLNIDINELLDETKTVPQITVQTDNVYQQDEIPETFCGKSCMACEYREELNCPGCREADGRRYGACRLADCCYNHMYSSCGQCASKSGCDKYQNIPGQQKTKMKGQAEAKIKFGKYAPLMRKWVRVLFCLIIIEIVAVILESDFVANWKPIFNQFGVFLSIGCSLCYAFVLLKLSQVSEGYQMAGACTLIAGLLDILKLFTRSNGGFAVILTLAVIVLVLVANYNEYMAHAFALKGINNYLASDWQAFWNWNIALRGAMILSIFFSFLGILLLLIALLALCALDIYQLFLLHRTVKSFAGQQK